jgi:hypothetical protein
MVPSYIITDTHEQGVLRRGEDPGNCDVHVADWPYECEAKDKNPDATVYVCETHGCWWHEPKQTQHDVMDLTDATRER